jgi:taurine dioxygenase
MTAAITRSNPAETAAITVLPFDAALGAEVRCGDVRSLADATFAQVRQTFLDHLVLLIRDQELTIAELLAFGRRFGELTKGAPVHIGQKPRDEQYPELAVISNVIENGLSIGSLGDGEAVWHTDSSFTDVPPAASALYAVELPPAGGDTGFANMYLALETLPAALRARIHGRTIKHDKRFTSGGQLRPGFDPDQDVRESPGPSHPIVRRHPETGNSALYLGRRPLAYINGLDLDESERLLDALWAHATRKEFTWHHQWRLGDILIWDNRCVMHRRDAFDPASRRIMHRTQTKGVPVLEAVESVSPHPRAYRSAAAQSS